MCGLGEQRSKVKTLPSITCSDSKKVDYCVAIEEAANVIAIKSLHLGEHEDDQRANERKHTMIKRDFSRLIEPLMGDRMLKIGLTKELGLENTQATE